MCQHAKSAKGNLQKRKAAFRRLLTSRLQTDQAAARTLPFCLRRYPIKPRTPRPRSIIPPVAGKGVAAAVMDKVPSATQLEQMPSKPKLPTRYPAPLITAENQASEVPTPKLCPVGAKML